MAVGVGVSAVAGLLGLIAVRGLAHFWPADVAVMGLADGSIVMGELVDVEYTDPASFEQAGGQDAGPIERWLVKTGNRRINGPDFRWVLTANVADTRFPSDVAVFERTEWGNAYGRISALYENGVLVANGNHAWNEMQSRLERVVELREEMTATQSTTIDPVNYKLERLRIERRRHVLEGTPEAPGLAEEERRLHATYREAETRLRTLADAMRRDAVEIVIMDGRTLVQPLGDVIRVWQPNSMSVYDKLLHYMKSLGVFLTGEPREANTEGGIFPAIFGTVMMVLLMAIIVAPLGVVAAVYLREYARQGLPVRLIRIAVNNLAGVPSIVYGVFGLGFFVYLVGGTIDDMFFPEAQPAPTFGTPGLIWASLTLALLTVPVVIVSTEEGLTRIPRSIREGSLALGATKAETLFRLVLPVASPSILTGIILAVARAAGEVAPLMLVGVVKLAPALPVDAIPPFIHLERKFMHLGFHIYDVGFQSPNVEAARPLVYATALLLIFIVIALNLAAIMLRSRLESRYEIVET
ncbi:MAG: phosphate ABC transporter permease PstA [Gammaproteobacteria bacterium]|nr:phosphate ABC transporter permease PstA [Gammaproteobacteria bacterium]MDE0226516.1 phosphate ABC transporter permease PstA [Gammaproteobacteria bacterium]